MYMQALPVKGQYTTAKIDFIFFNLEKTGSGGLSAVKDSYNSRVRKNNNHTNKKVKACAHIAD